MISILKISLVILILSVIPSCNENEIEEFNLIRGDINYGPSSPFSFVDDLDNNAYSEMIHVSEDNLVNQFNYRISIFDLESDSHIYSEVILAELKDVKAYDVNNNGMKEILYTYQNKDSLYLKIYNPFSDKILLHSKIQVAKLKIEGKEWVVGSSIEKVVDLNEDGYPEIILTLAANYSKQPRGILVFDVKNQKELWHYWVGPNVNNVKTYDFNNDGNLELYFNTTSPGNGSEANGTDDYHSYFIVLSNEGKLLFQAELGEENSATYVYINDHFGKTANSLITITRVNNFKYYNTFQNLIWKWDKELNFHIISKSDELHFDGQPIPIIYDEKPSIILTNQLRQLCILDTTLKLVKTLPYKFKFGTYLGAFDLNYDGIKEYVWNAGNDGLMLFDSDFEIIGKLPPLNKIFEVENGRKKRVDYIALDNEGRLFDFTIQKSSVIQKVISNPLLLGFIALFLINLYLIVLLLNRKCNWKWYRKQLQFFDEALSGLLVINNKGKIVDCNKKSELLLGKTKQDIAHKPLIDVFDERHSLICEWLNNQRNLHVNNEKLFEVQINSSKRVYKIFIQFIQSRFKRREGAIIILNDITLTIQSQKTAVWLTIAQKLAHEIKNPLSTIRLTLQRFKMDFDENPELKKEFSDLIENGISDSVRIQKVIDGFMKFSQIEHTEYGTVQLKEIVMNLIDSYSLKIESNITIKTEFDENLPFIYADGIQISNALTNLIDNAIQSVTGTGEVLIRVKYVEIINPDIISLLKKFIDIEISDTGKGMNEETLKRIFEPFYTSKEGGSGLGLIIAKRIIEEHKGTININSREGVGTSVYIRLPMQGSD
ncbi:MAG: hypothetical protein BMS9Abin39_0927 [Ignavibacteria bacterium]|nr:MAG: hypothetical protein BMS9Abin39_0927 [Ignavibacteria bacterium]